ncbi:membrane protein RL11P [Cercopithecine betaherpesvirus 5]|uniref:Membrane protein RL11P n=1 Tax=Simian cytomegalovirus (strain Colburn) TaxID=50292 RepID=G8XTR6_SCMVC|nr:membrane protein RL11P [Cercopithecine betaherpesvirus 5]
MALQYSYLKITCILFIICNVQLYITAFLVTTSPPFCNDCRRCTHIVTHNNETIILNSTYHHPDNPKSRWYWGPYDICNMKLGSKTRNITGLDHDCVNSSLVLRNLTSNSMPYEHHILVGQRQDDYYYNITVVARNQSLHDVPRLDECANKRCTTQVRYPERCNQRKPSVRTTTKKTTTKTTKNTKKTTTNKQHVKKPTDQNQPLQTTITITAPSSVLKPLGTDGNYTELGYLASTEFPAEHVAWGAAILIILLLAIWAFRYWLRKSKNRHTREYL